MTRKKFIKMLMGRGVSRNVARECAKAMRELKEAEDLLKHSIRIGDPERAALLEEVCGARIDRLHRWMGIASEMETKTPW